MLARMLAGYEPTGFYRSLVLYGIIMKQIGRDISGIRRRPRDSSEKHAVGNPYCARVERKAMVSLQKRTKVVYFHSPRSGPADLKQSRDIVDGIHLPNARCVHL